MIVVDASIALAWCLADEQDDVAEEALERAAREGAVAPTHWSLEVANGLLSAERRRRLSEADTARAARLLGDLAVELVPVELGAATSLVLEIARRHGLTAYDAAYLGLASFRSLPLATLDATLRTACAKEGVALAS